MLSRPSVSLGAGARVKVKTPGLVPEWSKWEPCQRTSSSVKRRLQQLFFKGDRRVSASVVYIANESARDRLKANGHTKVELRDAAGCSVVILAETRNLAKA